MAYDFRAATLPNALNQILFAQLIRHADEDADAFWFKHALVQDTAYASLLRHDRKRLHRLVAETLEQTTPERRDELAPRLAEHFDEAGETQRALFYFQRAAENAAARYANQEALDFYTRALDAAEELQADTRDSLYRARGMVYERIGEFEHARADLETARRIAQETGDAHAEWQSLLDLGYAWASRDYARTGEYYEKALELARASGDDARLAHTLNRVGNWHVNNDEPQRAVSYHTEALRMFEAQENARGIAETRDLLSMANWLGADYFSAEEHANAARAQFEALGDSLAVVNIQAIGDLKYGLLQGDTIVTAPRPQNVQHGDTAILERLQQLGWRAGEAFSLMVLGEGFAAAGEYARGLELERAAMAMAREIKHRQWLAGATMLHGEILARVLNFETALPSLENALTLARELGSMHWTRTGSGFLAAALIAQNDFTCAAEILDTALPSDARALSVGQRQGWAARAELALAQHDAARALYALEQLMRDAVNVTTTTVIPRVWILRARTLALQNDLQAAETLLRAAHLEAHNTHQPGWEWRSAAYLARVHRSQGRDAEAEREANAAQNIVKTLADNLNDLTARETFVTRAREIIWGA